MIRTRRAAMSRRLSSRPAYDPLKALCHARGMQLLSDGELAPLAEVLELVHYPAGTVFFKDFAGNLAAPLRIIVQGHVFWSSIADPDSAGHCCGLDDALDARRVADALGIAFHVMDLREAFNAELMSQSADWGCPDPAPIFIVGMPRSGSTLIEQILASHSQVEGTSELPNLAAIATGTGKYRHDGLVYPGTVGRFTQRDLAAFGKEYLRQVKRHRVEGRPFFIDKMPNNFIQVGWIALTLPNAKIINTRRHPLDSCLGVYKQLFAKGQHFTYDMFELAEFYHGYVNIMQHWHEVLPGRVLDVHYEDTVTDLEQQVRPAAATPAPTPCLP